MKFLENKKIHILLLVLVIILGFFLRFYKLGQVPDGLYTDETAIGYNAYAILQTHKDEHNKFMPLYFESFSDYKLPVYIYMVSVTEKVLGENPVAVRLPSAFFGFLSILALYFLVLLLSKKRTFALLSAFLLAINPWHTFFSRVGYEVNVATAFLVFGTLFFVLGITKKYNLGFLILSVFAFIISLYTYNVTRLVAPLIFLMLVFVYRQDIKKISKKKLFISMFIFFIGILPFLITFKSGSGFSSHEDILIIGNEVKAHIIETRSYFAALPGFVTKILFNYWILVVWQYLRNLVSFFSNDFFFLIGGDHPINSIGNFGMFYIFEFPLMIWGLYYGIKQKIRFLYPFYLWLLIVFFVGGIIKLVPHATRSYVVIIPMAVFSAYGMFCFLNYLFLLKNKIITKFVFCLSAVFVVYCCLFYFFSYFVRFPVEQAKPWRSKDASLMQYLRQHENEYASIYFDKNADVAYTSLLFYQLYPPDIFQKEAVYESDGLLIRPKQIGKYQYKNIDWEKDIKQSNILIVTNKNDKIPGSFQPVKIFNYPVRPVVFFYNNQIAQYPTTDVAYELFSTNKK